MNKYVGICESEINKKDNIINLYEESERTYEAQIISLEEDCIKSYETQSWFTVQIEGLKKMYNEEKLKSTALQVDVEFLKNLVSAGNICGKLEKIKPGDKYSTTIQMTTILSKLTKNVVKHT